MKKLVCGLILVCAVVGIVKAYAGDKAGNVAAAVAMLALVGFGAWKIAKAIESMLRPTAKRQSGGIDLGALDARLADIRESSSKLPNPPAKGDYRAAGVSMTACTRCQKPLKSMGYFFGLDGSPTVYCPSCWSKATLGEKADAFWKSMTTAYDRRDL
jgi:hypothetical protein